jgi:hypothetical protein
MSDDDHINLMIRKENDKERAKSDGLYSRKYIETAVTWLFVAAGSTVVGLVVTAVWTLVSSHFKP